MRSGAFAADDKDHMAMAKKDGMKKDDAAMKKDEPMKK
jgi:hypothetical protein